MIRSEEYDRGFRAGWDSAASLWRPRAKELEAICTELGLSTGSPYQEIVQVIEASRLRCVEARVADYEDLRQALDEQPGALEWRQLINRVKELRLGRGVGDEAC